MTSCARHADLRWDCILSAELSRRYKPDPEVYLRAAELLGLQPEQVMMVAAHNHDLLAARAVGFGTAFVYRTAEYGPRQSKKQTRSNSPGYSFARPTSNATLVRPCAFACSRASAIEPSWKS